MPGEKTTRLAETKLVNKPVSESVSDKTQTKPPQSDQQVDPHAETSLNAQKGADASAETKINDIDPLAQSPTVANLLGDQTLIDENSVFARLDRRLVEQYSENKVLKQRFVLERTLGAGGMGNVYLAKDLLREELEDSSPYVAIKVLNEECRTMPGALQALQSEAKKAQTLSHPNIVTVYDFDRDRETAFITMEYIEGDALKDLMRKSKMSYQKSMGIIELIARGLAYAHQQGFVHADIKPANIFCAQNGAVKILDFGIAKAFTDAAKETRSLGDKLTEGALTPAYASLEMLQGEPLQPADDVYSLAVMAYEMLSGRHPFLDAEGFPVSAEEASILGLKPEAIHGLSRKHMHALRKGLAFERKDRYRDGGAFIDAIKVRSFKREASLFAAAIVITILVVFSGEQALESVVPLVSSLKPEMAEVGKAIEEGDVFLKSEDIDLAHRLYSQAWALTNDLTRNDVQEREKAQAILKDRMGMVSEVIIERSRNKDLDEYQLRELLMALEFLLQDGITPQGDEIKKAIKNINNRLEE